jgi:hypothetical protein
MNKFILVPLFALVFASSAFAAAAAHSGGYKSAGCGLGSMVITDDGFMQIFAATTNGIGGQTFAITSGTSNCTGAGGIAKADAAQEMYVSSNLDALSQEMAQGSGEHLSALATLFGCSNNAAFSAAVRNNYSSIVGQEVSTENMINGVRNTVASDSILSQSCSS